MSGDEPNGPVSNRTTCPKSNVRPAPEVGGRIEPLIVSGDHEVSDRPPGQVQRPPRPGGPDLVPHRAGMPLTCPTRRPATVQSTATKRARATALGTATPISEQAERQAPARTAGRPRPGPRRRPGRRGSMRPARAECASTQGVAA